jgi:hypothetical protein
MLCTMELQHLALGFRDDLKFTLCSQHMKTISKKNVNICILLKMNIFIETDWDHAVW